MSDRIVEFTAVIALSLALLYSGVAWTLEGCAWSGSYAEHAAHLSHVSSTVADDDVPVVHCASINQQVGPAARVAPTEIRRLDKGIVLHPASVFSMLFASQPNALWREALFRKPRATSLSSDLARHLFLSILRI